MANQRCSVDAVLKSERLTFSYNSTVDVPCVAAECKEMNKNHIDRQSQDVESFIKSVHGTI
jgi:hypothetical protein